MQNNLKAINVTSASVSGVQLVLDSIKALDKCRDNLVKITGKTGEIQKAYASQMNDTFGAEWWNSKGEIKKAVKDEHQKFIAAFEAIGKTRAWIDQVWSRIKDDAGRVKTVTPKVQGGKDIDGKTFAELKTIYNRFTAVSEDEAPLSYKVKKELEYILDQLGVEI